MFTMLPTLHPPVDAVPPPPSQDVDSDLSQFFAALSQATTSLPTHPLIEVPSEFADFGFGDSIMDLTSLDSPLSTSTAGSESGHSVDSVITESESDNNSGFWEEMVQDPPDSPLSTSTTGPSEFRGQPRLRLVMPAASIGEEQMVQDLLESPLSPLTPLHSDDEDSDI